MALPVAIRHSGVGLCQDTHRWTTMRSDWSRSTVLNNDVLADLGHTDLTGRAIIRTFAVIVLGLWNVGSASSQERRLFGTPMSSIPALVGVILGWLVWTNPYGAILAGGTRSIPFLPIRGRRRSDT